MLVRRGFVDSVLAVQGVEADRDLPAVREREAGGWEARPGVVGDVAGIAGVCLLLFQHAADRIVGKAGIGIGSADRVSAEGQARDAVELEALGGGADHAGCRRDGDIGLPAEHVERVGEEAAVLVGVADDVIGGVEDVGSRRAVMEGHLRLAVQQVVGPGGGAAVIVNEAGGVAVGVVSGLGEDGVEEGGAPAAIGRRCCNSRSCRLAPSYCQSGGIGLRGRSVACGCPGCRSR